MARNWVAVKFRFSSKNRLSASPACSLTRVPRHVDMHPSHRSSSPLSLILSPPYSFPLSNDLRCVSHCVPMPPFPPLRTQRLRSAPCTTDWVCLRCRTEREKKSRSVRGQKNFFKSVCSLHKCTPIPSIFCSVPQSFHIKMSCDSLDPYFLINGGGIVVMFGLLCYFTHLRRVAGVQTETWGTLYAYVAVWCFLPPTIFFAIFHEAAPETYESSREMACAAVRRLPLQLLAFVYILMWLISLLRLRCSCTTVVDGRDKLDEYFYESPQHPVKVGEKLIVLGVVARGSLFIRMLQRFADCAAEKVNAQPANIQRAEPLLQCPENRASTEEPLLEEEGSMVPAWGMPHSNVQAHLVDYTGESKQAVLDDALATGVVKSAEELHVTCPEASAKCLFTLPYDDNSIDRVVLTPSFRELARALPLPGAPTVEEAFDRNMRLLLAEALRVLRKGGTIVYTDVFYEVLLVQADLRDLGFTTTVEDLHIPLFVPIRAIVHPVAWRLCGTKECDPVAPDAHAVDVKHCEDALSQPLYSETFLLGLAWVQQTFVFAILCWLTAIVYPHASVPRNIEPSERLNNCMVVCTLLYPVFASMVRSALAENRKSVHHLALTFAKMEVRVLLLTFVTGSVALFAPEFIIQNAFGFFPAAILSALSLAFTTALLNLFLLLTIRLGAVLECKRRNVPSEYIEILFWGTSNRTG